MTVAISDQRHLRWTVLSPEDILLQSWDDDHCAVVYSGRSGDTHLVSPLACEILRLLTKAPHTSEMLLRGLTEAFEDHDEPDALDIIEAVLFELQSIDLISSDQN